MNMTDSSLTMQVEMTLHGANLCINFIITLKKFREVVYQTLSKTVFDLELQSVWKCGHANTV